MTNKLKNTLIGVFVVSSFAIIVSMVLFLKPHVGDGKMILHVRFTNVAGIVPGTRVTFAGKPVGEVVEIREIDHSREGPSDEAGRVYCYELTLKLDSRIHVYTTDEVSLRTTGLMGERAVTILPKSITSGQKMESAQGKVLFAISSDPLENTFNQVAKVARNIDTAVETVTAILNEERGNLHETIASTQAAMAAVALTLDSAHQNNLVPAFAEATQRASDTLAMIESGLDDGQILFKASNVLTSLEQIADVVYRDGSDTLKQINQITGDLASGTGTVGRLIAGDDAYLRLTSVMSKAETLMNDINHYGLLFQYDKGWQRTRTKRANLLQAIQSPKEFRNYFEGEMDIMTTSLGRLTELMEQKDKEGSEESANFQRTFANLMKKMNDLNEAMKFYNQELISKSEEMDRP